MRKQTKTLAVLSAAALFAAAAPIMTNTELTEFWRPRAAGQRKMVVFITTMRTAAKETNTWKKRNGDWFYPR